MSATAPGHERYAELVVGLALDALEPADEQTLTEHLPGCPECRRLLDDMHQVASAMAYGVPDADPPPTLLDGIRAGMAAAPRPSRTRAVDPAGDLPALPAAGAPRPAPRPVPPEPGTDRPDGGAPVTPLPVRWAGRRAVLLAAAVLLVFAALGGYAQHLRAGRDAANTALAREQQVLAHLQHPGAYTVTLTSGGAPTGAAVVDGQQVWLITHDLGRNDTASSIYVLWAVNRTGQMVPVGGFDVRDVGVTVMHAELPAGIVRPEQFGVTHEAGRTVPRSPGTAVLGTVGIAA